MKQCYEIRSDYFVFQDCLVTVFENGKLLKDYSFKEVRANAEIDLVKFSQISKKAKTA
jgi:hypothetical protein